MSTYGECLVDLFQVVHIVVVAGSLFGKKLEYKFVKGLFGMTIPITTGFIFYPHIGSLRFTGQEFVQGK